MFFYHLPAFAWNCFNIGKKDNYMIPSVSLRVTRYSSLVQSVIQSNIQTGIIMHQTSVLWKSSHFVLCAILMHISVKSHEYQVYTTHNSQVEKHKANANLASYMTRKKIYSMLHVNQSCMLNATHTLQIFFPCTPNLRGRKKNTKCIWEAENISLNNCISQRILPCSFDKIKKT